MSANNPFDSFKNPFARRSGQPAQGSKPAQQPPTTYVQPQPIPRQPVVSVHRHVPMQQQKERVHTETSVEQRRIKSELGPNPFSRGLKAQPVQTQQVENPYKPTTPAPKPIPMLSQATSRTQKSTQNICFAQYKPTCLAKKQTEPVQKQEFQWQKKYNIGDMLSLIGIQPKEPQHMQHRPTIKKKSTQVVSTHRPTIVQQSQQREVFQDSEIQDVESSRSFSNNLINRDKAIKRKQFFRQVSGARKVQHQRNFQIRPIKQQKNQQFKKSLLELEKKQEEQRLARFLYQPAMLSSTKRPLLTAQRDSPKQTVTVKPVFQKRIQQIQQKTTVSTQLDQIEALADKIRITKRTYFDQAKRGPLSQSLYQLANLRQGRRFIFEEGSVECQQIQPLGW